MGLIYVDACILIDALEDPGRRGARARQTIQGAEVTLASSPLALTESLVGPLRDGSLELRDRHLALYRRFLAIEFGFDGYLHAAEIRARYGLRTPDALHLAAAQLAGCDAFWTNDKRLSEASHGLAIDVIGEAG